MSAIRYLASVATSIIRLSSGRSPRRRRSRAPPSRRRGSSPRDRIRSRPRTPSRRGRTWERQIARVPPCPPETVLRFSAQVRLETDPCHSESSSPSPRSSRRSRPSRPPLPPPPRSHSTWRRPAPATCCARSQWTDFEAIAPGTDVTYTWDATRPWLAYPTIVVRNGSTTGVCNWDQPGPTVLAICSFSSGTGRLTQFHLVVDVSVDADNVWHWDGSYWFGPGH